MSHSTTLPAPDQEQADVLVRLCEAGWLPDALVRAGMRRLMQQRLRDEGAYDGELRAERFAAFLDDLRSSPIAIETDKANDQHYELPASFFREHLGPRLKYSCCLYPQGNESLAEGEIAMLERYVVRAGLADGQDILELGCGWGSLSLWLAERFPSARITALSNSNSQREFIEARAAERGLRNLRVLTGNIVSFDFSPGQIETFDRVISIEMFEHMKNYGLLLEKISRWMRPDAKLFLHVFAHKFLSYHFQVKDGTDWMSRYFFTGGTMPSDSLFLHFQDHLRVTRQWWVPGTHYERTANQWLAALDAARSKVMPALIDTYGDAQAAIWFQRWRMFYMAVAELFGFDDGNEWGVGHYLLERR
ncbi:MAG TPA: cyclopropane-fatty-acyl-phospholipid synthase family protein [Moraxellaceae bacterium]|nr:cyclopropane-fatty-acyl-phospholipid synthase family protein [Moraxellaceae bacterium]